ncbi:MAG: CPBP family intramembrane metalloprotease [Gemmatimonadota bacterium]
MRPDGSAFDAVPGPSPPEVERNVIDIERDAFARSTARDGWLALAYYLAYLAYLFRRPENELVHWFSMVLVPLVIAGLALPRGRRVLREALASVGLRRGNLRKGIGWAVLAGGVITVFQVFAGGRADAIQALFRSGRALWLFPFAFAVMLELAGFTEEFLFRGFIQTRLEPLLRSRWAAVLVTALLFGVYHLPYAYLNPQWPSHGDWGAAWLAALGNGVPGGLLLGALYVFSRGNLLACVVLHALNNAAPAMTLIHFGGG